MNNKIYSKSAKIIDVHGFLRKQLEKSKNVLFQSNFDENFFVIKFEEKKTWIIGKILTDITRNNVSLIHTLKFHFSIYPIFANVPKPHNKDIAQMQK